MKLVAFAQNEPDGEVDVAAIVSEEGRHRRLPLADFGLLCMNLPDYSSNPTDDFSKSDCQVRVLDPHIIGSGKIPC